MKVLLYAGDVFTDHLAHGEGLIAYTAVKALRAAGHEVHVCADTVDLQSNGAPVAVIGRFPLPSLQPLYRLHKIQRYARAHGPFDVVHWLFPQDPEDMLPLIAGEHGLVLGPLATSWPVAPQPRRRGDYVRLALRPLLHLLASRLARRPKVMLFATPLAERTFARSAGRREVVPFGIDIEQWHQARRRVGKSERPTVTLVARLEPEKNVLAVVPLAQHLVAAVPSCRIVVAGSGSLLADLRRELVSSGLSGSVICLGVVARADLATLVASSWATLSLSLHEPFGMAVLESLAAGTPVVAYDSGGSSFLLEGSRAGSLLPAHAGPQDLAAALARLLASPDKRAEAEAATEEVCQRFDIQTVRRAFERAYVEARLLTAPARAD